MDVDVMVTSLLIIPTLGLKVMYLLSTVTGPRPCSSSATLTLGWVGWHGREAVSYCTDCWKSNPSDGRQG